MNTSEDELENEGEANFTGFLKDPDKVTHYINDSAKRYLSPEFAEKRETVQEAAYGFTTLSNKDINSGTKVIKDLAKCFNKAFLIFNLLVRKELSLKI